MIVSFGDAATRDLHSGARSARARRFPPDVKARARRMFDRLTFAVQVEDLRLPPANRLHQLQGDLAGFWSVSVNDQWRIIFKWTAAGPADVLLIDYHD